LSPSCRLYPDGIIDAGWLQKHQELVPSVVLCFYSLTSDPTLATLHDNQIKTDISNLKNAILQSGYKSRVSVVLLPDESKSSIDGAQERIDNIRKGCGLDPKMMFFVPHQKTREELERAVDNALTTVYTQAVEYYRDLGRHCRKKRGRGFAPQPTVPPTSGTSQTLSLPGWNVRYDFKSAVFAEFRQEMEVALRSYDQAYETLLGSDVLEAIPSWSPRWNEARLLADTMAVRSLRCLLWNGQHSTAVRRWQSHRDRMCDLIDRRGRGTSNYGWKAWESRWALVMANLMDRVDIPALAPGTGALFLQPEKSVAGERLPPWELLHHTGYWHHAAARHLFIRRALAYNIPEDDRRPPDFSPASKVASRAYTYDTYMCPEPHEEYPLTGEGGVDHSKLIVECLVAAAGEFRKREQLRLAAEIALECAKEFASSQAWQEVFNLLLPMWETIQVRFGGWLQIVEDLGWTLRTAAANIGRGDLVVAIDWELLDATYTRRQNWHYDITKALQDMPELENPRLALGPEAKPSFLSASFVFKNEEGNAGQACQAQFAISSNAFPNSAVIALDAIRIDFEGNVQPVIITHGASSRDPGQKAGSVRLSLVEMAEDSAQGDDASSWKGQSDLILHPGVTLVLEMAIQLREAGNARATTAALSLSCDGFSLQQVVSLEASSDANVWFVSSRSRKAVSRFNPHSIHILPRPPKLEIKPLGTLDQYYTNEPVELHISIVNAEESHAEVKLDVAMLGEDPQGFKLSVGGDEIDTAAAHAEESALLGIPLGVIASTKSIEATIHVDAVELSTSYDFTIRAAYRVVTDPATPIIQTLTFKLTLVNPFEANYDLLPRVHQAPWPSLFDPETILDYGGADEALQPLPRGLSQTWSLVTRYASFAAEDLQVTDLSVLIHPSHGVRCSTARRSPLPTEGITIKPKTIEEAQFDLDAQKLSLDDRGPSNLDASFVIKWRRIGSAAKAETSNTTTLPVPRLAIFGIEPRVLASVSYLQAADPLIVLTITIENPSNHVLTFGLSMEPSDEFAFSGAKQTSLNLLPVSRRALTYRLLPFVRGAWIKPGLAVRDKYFQKVLRIIPTEGMKLDKEGVLVWVPPEDDESIDGS